jgi:hypothetical protein
MMVCLLSVSLVGPLYYVDSITEWLKMSEPEESADPQAQASQSAPPAFLIPQPLPLPMRGELPSQERSKFRIPNAEFSLSVQVPEQWEWRALTSDLVRFTPKSPLSPEPKTVLTFSSGCFGSCDDLSKNIASALQRHLHALNRQGITPRVTHWHVHHKGWVEYSILTDSADGQAMLTGVSLRSEEEWLNALRCEMSAPIDYPLESEELLHLAWRQWAPLFVLRCRNYKVLSWN